MKKDGKILKDTVWLEHYYYYRNVEKGTCEVTDKTVTWERSNTAAGNSTVSNDALLMAK